MIHCTVRQPYHGTGTARYNILVINIQITYRDIIRPIVLGSFGSILLIG